jgi:HEAT repeat protein
MGGIVGPRGGRLPSRLPGATAGRWSLAPNRAAAALLAAALLLASPSASAQEDAEASRALLKARELLRTGKVEDRLEAIRRLIALDSAPAITCLEEAIQRSSAEMDKLAKEFDAADEEYWAAHFELKDCKAKYPSLVPDAQARFDVAKERYDGVTARLRGNLGICIDGAKSLAAFRSPAAVERIVKGATGSPNPLARQLYVQALGAPGKEGCIPVLLDLLKAGESRVRSAALRSLRNHPPRRDVLDAVLPLLKDRNWSVRVAAAEVVARMPLDHAVPALVDSVGRETGEPALQVDSLLRSLTGASFAGKGPAWKAWWEKNGTAIREGGFKRPEEPEAGPKDPGASEAAFFSIPIESDNFLVIMDLSGSMLEEMKSVDKRTEVLLAKHGYEKNRLAVALVQAYQMIEGLPAASRVNMLAFSDKVTRFGSRATPATSSLKKNLVTWLNGQKTGYMTNIWDALRQGFGDHLGTGGATRFDELPDTIIFLTDGWPTAGRFRDRESLAALVEFWNASAGAVVHCVGVGDDFDGDLLAGLAKATGGFYMDQRAGRIIGERVRPSVPAERACPATAGMTGGVLARYEGGDVHERRAMIPWIAGLASWTAEAIPILAKGLDDPEEGIPDAAAAGLASLGEPGLPFLSAALDGSSDAGALAAARALGGMGPAAASAVPALEKVAAAGGPRGEAAKAALAAIRARAKGK